MNPLRTMSQKSWVRLLVCAAGLAALLLSAYRRPEPPWLTTALPEAAPYNVEEARVFAPPYEKVWETELNPGTCGSCHRQIFDEWNGSMMSNSWRDPAWRAAFLLLARKTATDGNCDVPQPPDGTPRARLNPFADGDACRSKFDFGRGEQVFARSGSLLDGFCSRCHMPTNYADNIPLQNIGPRGEGGHEHGMLNTHFDPTSDHGTGLAFATVEEWFRNTATGQRGIFCGVCHTMGDSRTTPFHNFQPSGQPYTPAKGTGSRVAVLGAAAEHLEVGDPQSPNLGYDVGAGSFRLSPHAIVQGEVFGPLRAAPNPPGQERDPYLSAVFGRDVDYGVGEFKQHSGVRHVKFERAEMCAACHDVTNALPLKNELGKWVGGFPIERTYTEWLTSRYADRPGNAHFDPAFQRDCQTCHMQQDYGQPGTARTLYQDGKPAAPLAGKVADEGPERDVVFSHHFIGGNAYITQMIGADVDDTGRVESYPELSAFSYSSADPNSPYYNAYWVNAQAAGKPTRHARLAWDRLRNAVSLELAGPTAASAGDRVPLRLAVTNTGCGHNFPSGFPEGRVAWVALHAWDLASGEELPIHDAHWDRTTLGVGDLTTEDLPDPNFPKCKEWKFPAGSPDPWSYQFRAMATLGDGCPTLDLVYAVPLNMVVDGQGLPVAANGEVLAPETYDRESPQFRDLDGDGDLFDDSFLMDTRLRPLPHAGAAVDLSERYSVVLPEGTRGPVAVVAAVYYQSLEAVVAKKFLGNMADTDLDRHLEPCVLGGSCDGRIARTEPPAVEGAPPVPLTFASWVIGVAGQRDERAPQVVAQYPAPGSSAAYRETVVKVSFSEPVSGVDERTFTLTDAAGRPVPAYVDQIGEGTWGLLPHGVYLELGQVYTARLEGAVCDHAGNCQRQPTRWSFRVTDRPSGGERDTRVPRGFPGYMPPPPDAPPTLLLAQVSAEGTVALRFSEPVMNVTPMTVAAYGAGPSGGCSPLGEPVQGRLAGGTDGTQWVFHPAIGQPRPECLRVEAVYDLAGQRIAPATVALSGTAVAASAGAPARTASR